MLRLPFLMTELLRNTNKSLISNVFSESNTRSNLITSRQNYSKTRQFFFFFSFLLTINLKLILVHVEIKIVNKEAATKQSTLLLMLCMVAVPLNKAM